MKAQWLKLAARFDALGLRERAMVAVAALALTAFALYLFALAPQWRAAEALQRQLEQNSSETTTLRTRLQELAGQVQDPDAALNTRLGEVRRQVAELEQKFKTIEHKLVPPQKVAALLQTLLERSPGLRLVALRTLPPVSLGDDENGNSNAANAAKTANAANPASSSSAGASAATAASVAAPNPSAGIYKHAVEITVEGGYNNLAAYLAQLERAPQQLYWSRASLRADYPLSTLTLRVFTLSTERTWLAV